MKFVLCLFFMLFLNQLFCQVDFYIETDEANYSYEQDIYITFYLHNTTIDTVIVTFSGSFPFDYYIDEELFIIGSYGVVFDVIIPPDSTFSTIPYAHTENVSIGDHILIGEFNSDWLSDPVSIAIESVGVENYESLLISYHLSNYPNPFNPTTEISFETTNLLEDSRIEIYNSRGQKLKVLPVILNGVEGSAFWDGTNENDKQVPSGVYLYRLVSNGKDLAANKMLLLK